MKKIIITLAAVLCCAMTMAVLTACTSDNDDNPASGIDSRMMGNLVTLTEVKDCADYICCSSHIPRSYGEISKRGGSMPPLFCALYILNF